MSNRILPLPAKRGLGPCFLMVLSYGLLFCGAVADFAVENIDAGQQFFELNIKGRVKEGKSWQDSNGYHIVLITHLESGEFCSRGFSTELYAYKFTRTDTGYVQNWSIKDFGENECSAVRLISGSLKVVDIDNDGVAETRFIYHFEHDCCDPITVKYMLHKGDIKLAIRGKIPMLENEMEQYQKKMDDAYGKFSAQVKQFASEDWDSFVQKRYDVFSGE